MITKLEIKGFKSLVDVSIELGAVNVFIGANGSGKSNLLEAVGVLSAIVSGSAEEETFRYRGVRTGHPNTILSSFRDRPLKSISISAIYSNTAYCVEMKADENKAAKWALIGESMEIEGKPIFDRSNNGFNINIHDEQTKVLLPRQLLTKSIVNDALFFYAMKLFSVVPAATNNHFGESYAMLEILERYAIFTPSTPQLRGFLDDIVREPLGLGGSGLGQATDEMLRIDPEKLGPFDLEDVYDLIDWADSLTIQESTDQSAKLRIGDRFMGNGHKTVSLLEASEGALYVLFLLALVGHEDSPKFFAVDNFDQALHPRLARALTKAISDQILADGSRQMLATTHNPLVLDGLDLLDDRVRLFTVDRDSMGASQVKRVMVSEELMAEANNGLSLSRLWLMGRLGGIPKYL